MTMNSKELDKFVRHFILKSVQVIVQSRLGSERISTQCNPTGNDWFNLAINDIKDINEQTKKCLESICSDNNNKNTLNSIESSLKVRQEWQVCCEISLKTNDGDSMMLEYWLFNNKPTDIDFDEMQIIKKHGALPVVIYNIYNRMSLMLKSLISLTRATPGYKLSFRGQSADSYVICYRVYLSQSDDENLFDKNDGFTSPISLGSIKSAYNELSVSVNYRTDMTFGCRNVQENSMQKSPKLLPLKKDHFKEEEKNKKIEKRDINKPLMAAFATVSSNSSIPLIPEAPFSNLLHTESNDSLNKTAKDSALNNKSEPIIIPSKNSNSNNKSNETTSSPVYSSSGDSFVFVELKAPFASDEQHELGSFFNGPSPTFTGSCSESNCDITDITVQLAEMETNAQQWDSFVDSICCESEKEE